MTVDDWDAVDPGPPAGHVLPGAAGRRVLADRVQGRPPLGAGRIVTTSSGAGLIGSLAQTNYSTAKAGIAAFTINIAAELGRLGVTANSIAPSARSRMTEEAFAEMMAKPESGFDAMDPANISPIVVWLGSDQSGHVTGRVFECAGGELSVADGWQHGTAGRQGRPLGPGRARPRGRRAHRRRTGPRCGLRRRVVGPTAVATWRIDSSDVGTTDVVATDGRVIGRRAIQTRRRILDATAALLRQQGALDLKVIDVAREVGDVAGDLLPVLRRRGGRHLLPRR